MKMLKSTLEIPFVDKKEKEQKLVFETDNGKLIIKKGKAVLGTVANWEKIRRDVEEFARKA